MGLVWTHEPEQCDMGEKCTTDTDCEGFPTQQDRIAMARAAYQLYAEADGTDLVDFVQDVEMLARAEGLVQKVWVVTTEVSNTPIKVFGARQPAINYAACRATAHPGIEWEVEEHEVSD